MPHLYVETRWAEVARTCAGSARGRWASPESGHVVPNCRAGLARGFRAVLAGKQRHTRCHGHQCFGALRPTPARSRLTPHLSLFGALSFAAHVRTTRKTTCICFCKVTDRCGHCPARPLAHQQTPRLFTFTCRCPAQPVRGHCFIFAKSWPGPRECCGCFARLPGFSSSRTFRFLFLSFCFFLLFPLRSLFCLFSLSLYFALSLLFSFFFFSFVPYVPVFF